MTATLPPGQTLQGRAVDAEPPVRRGFLDLEDFGAAPGLDESAKVIPPDAPPPVVEPDPNLLTMTREDAAAAHDAAFQDGFEKGAGEREAVLQQHYESCVATLAAEFRAENQRRDAALADMTQTFVATVVEIVRGLTALDGSALAGIERDFVADARAFVKECEGPVTIRCVADDAAPLQSLFRDKDDIRLETVPGDVDSPITIISATNTIIIDPKEWRRTMAEKIVAAVTALAGQRIGQPLRNA
ncbi:hypothetical protein [Acetobacter sp.]|uniref:hypothetical protein n=1 Tax=Acetobacter sp. TaxID=440 RepID=UPI0039ECB4CE